ncbi:hypothetical protein F4861DRAFT_544380 [Xylaria intraflava]|nr:hypothetical protein F4861DRAFT_544380 [Xylaria intraflava]
MSISDPQKCHHCTLQDTPCDIQVQQTQQAVAQSDDDTIIKPQTSTKTSTKTTTKTTTKTSTKTKTKANTIQRSSHQTHYKTRQQQAQLKHLVEQLDKHIKYMEAKKKELLHQSLSFTSPPTPQLTNSQTKLALMDPLPLDMSTWAPSEDDDLLFAPEAMRGYDPKIHGFLPDSGLSHFLGNPQFFTWEF